MYSIPTAAGQQPLDTAFGAFLTLTQLKVLIAAALIALGLYVCVAFVMPLGARALPAILIVGWIYLVTRPISAAWREHGPAPAVVLGTVAFQAFFLLWIVMVLAVAARSIITGETPLPATREHVGLLFLWLTAPFWWGVACSLAMLFRRVA
jgi:hypothetical protein